MEELHIRYFGCQPLHFPIPIPVSPTYHHMSYEEVIEAGDDYYQMKRFHYLPTSEVECRNGPCLLVEEVITPEDEEAGVLLRESCRYPASEWVLSKRSMKRMPGQQEGRSFCAERQITEAILNVTGELEVQNCVVADNRNKCDDGRRYHRSHDDVFNRKDVSAETVGMADGCQKEPSFHKLRESIKMCLSLPYKLSTVSEKEKSCVNLISKERKCLSAEYDLRRKSSTYDRKQSEKRWERSSLKRRPGKVEDYYSSSTEWADSNIDAYSDVAIKVGPCILPFLEVFKLENIGHCPEDSIMSRDMFLLQVCSGMDGNSVGTCAKLILAPIDSTFADDAPLLPSSFRILPVDFTVDASSPNRTLDLALALEIGPTGNRAAGDNSRNCASMRSVMTLAFQFELESHLQENVASMARQYIRSILSSVQRAIVEKGGQFQEASVSGSKKPAEDGQLVILAAEEKASQEVCYCRHLKHPPHSMKETGMRECPDFFPVSIISKLRLDTFVISPSAKHELKVRLDDTKREYYTIDSKVGNGETASTCPVDDYMRVVRDALNAKRYEIDSVLLVIN
ncbi:hypothetical protein GIB67_027538 [Kingdonia uniflora]|uniref:Uncharacterized protein n=1 Tax=Kingdonia uniflora TaxID=39325 RepID=A0A7J7NL63_9MAGN|nr:hypothetical protein GIB67_027538 [Kingdonia uniflora]